MSTFAAAYAGDCDGCLRDIEEGDEIGYGPFGELLCEWCYDSAWEDLDEDVA